VKPGADKGKFYDTSSVFISAADGLLLVSTNISSMASLSMMKKTKEYTLMLKHIWEFAMYVEPDGSYTEDKNTAEGDDNGAYILKYSDGFWTVVGSLSQEQLKEKRLLK